MVTTHESDTSQQRCIARLALIWLSSLLIAGFGCATTPSDEAARELTPSGPGTVFPSVEVAVVDALAWSHLRAKQGPISGHAQGGSIRAVEGGFTYGLPVVAPDDEPDVVRYELDPDDVAHFRLNARSTNPATNRLRERFSRRDRDTVNHLDPAHRPLFILTPRLMVRAYHGSTVGELDVVQLDPRRRSDTETVYLVRTD
jgi:hypothetical protein